MLLARRLLPCPASKKTTERESSYLKQGKHLCQGTDNPPSPSPCPRPPRSAYSPNMHSVLLDGRAATCQTAARGLRSRTLRYAGAERQLLVQPTHAAALEPHMPVASQVEQQRATRAPMAGASEAKVAKADQVGDAAGRLLGSGELRAGASGLQCFQKAQLPWLQAMQAKQGTAGSSPTRPACRALLNLARPHTRLPLHPSSHLRPPPLASCWRTWQTWWSTAPATQAPAARRPPSPRPARPPSPRTWPARR